MHQLQTPKLIVKVSENRVWGHRNEESWIITQTIYDIWYIVYIYIIFIKFPCFKGLRCSCFQEGRQYEITQLIAKLNSIPGIYRLRSGSHDTCPPTVDEQNPSPVDMIHFSKKMTKLSVKKKTLGKNDAIWGVLLIFQCWVAQPRSIEKGVLNHQMQLSKKHSFFFNRSYTGLYYHILPNYMMLISYTMKIHEIRNPGTLNNQDDSWKPYHSLRFFFRGEKNGFPKMNLRILRNRRSRQRPWTTGAGLMSRNGPDGGET